MATHTPRPVRAAAVVGDRCGEGAIWCAEERAVYWTDINRFLVHRLIWPECRLTTWEFDEPATALALSTEPGRFLVSLASRLIWWWPGTDRRTDHGFVLKDHPRVRFNDGRADPAGRFWIGSMYNNVDARGGATDEYVASDRGALYMLDAGGTAIEKIGAVGISNTLCWSPCGAWFYFADSMRNTISRYAYDLSTGDIDYRGVLLQGYPAGAPDGSAIDSAGYVWNCRWGGGGIVRVAPDGTVDSFHAVPTLNVTTCVFGGPDLSTLFITSALNDANPEDRLAGTLWAMEAGIPGLPENRVLTGLHDTGAR